MKQNQNKKFLKNILFLKKIDKNQTFSLRLPIKKDNIKNSSIINKQQLKYFLKQKNPNSKNQLPSNLLFIPLNKTQITIEDKNIILFFYKNNLFFPNQIKEIDWTIINKNFSFFYKFAVLLKMLSTKK